MNQSIIDKIKKAAADKYGDDLDIAVAEHIMGEAVITFSGGQIPSGADYPQIAKLRAEVEGVSKQLGKGKSPKAKASSPKKTVVDTPKPTPAKKAATPAPAKKRLSRMTQPELLEEAAGLGIVILATDRNKDIAAKIREAR